MLLCSSLCFAQTGTLDQVSPSFNASFNGEASLNWQCNVRAGMDGILEGFNMNFLGSAGSTIDIGVRRGGGWNTSAVLFQTTVTMLGTCTYEIHFIDTSSAGIALTTGELFVIEISNGSTEVFLQGSYDVVNPLYPEDLFLNGPGCFADCCWRIGFETYMLPVSSGPVLSVSNFAAGALATFTVSGATPSGTVQIALSLTGNGPLTTPFGVAELSPPITPLPAMLADTLGDASMSVTVPAGTTVWFQALDFGSATFSNGLQEVVQ